MAAEVLDGKGYESVIDYWSIGCIVYEMLMNMPPFQGETPQEVFQSIMSFDPAHLSFENEEEISPSAQHFIRQLLSPEPTTRLGYKGFEDISSHPFFKGVDFSNISQEETPFTPDVRKKNSILISFSNHFFIKLSSGLLTYFPNASEGEFKLDSVEGNAVEIPLSEDPFYDFNFNFEKTSN